MALSRQLILDAALEILDDYGLSDLSMRRVAGSLGVQPGALYNHVSDKQTLLAGVADQILGQVAEPLGRWRPALEEWASNVRVALLAHRDSADLVATARGFQLSQHETTKHPATLLAAAGLPPAEAVVAATTCLHFVLGHVAEEQARLDWQRFGRPGTELSKTGSLDADETFSLGLGLILDGVQARL